MATDISRLHSLLLNTGLQNKDNPLYQFLNTIIQILQSGDIGGGGGTTILNSNVPGPMGAMGAIIFPPDANDGDEFPPIMGPQGNPGPTGIQGPIGPALQGIDGNDGEDGLLLVQTAVPFGTASALTFLESHTASASASLNFTNISSTYDAYLFIWANLLPVTNAVNFIARMSTNAGVSYDSGTNYGYSLFEATNTPFNTTIGADSGLTLIELDHALSNSGNYGSGGWAALLSPNGGVFKYLQSQCASLKSDNHIYISFGTGIYLITTVVNAIQFLMSSGNISSGTIRMYGFSKS